jgi:hypothetical protein
MLGCCSAMMTADAWEVGFGKPFGGVPVAVAVFLTVPASRLACVVTYVAVQVVWALGARVEPWHVIPDRPGIGSVTLIFVSVTFPVFVTV